MRIGKVLAAIPFAALAALAWKTSLASDECCGGDGSMQGLNEIAFGGGAVVLGMMALAVALVPTRPRPDSDRRFPLEQALRARVEEEMDDLFE